MSKSTSIKITAIVLALAVGGGAFFVGWLMGNDWQVNSDPTKITPTIDGIIEKREWLRSSYYNIPFYLDVDNEIDPIVDLANVDGWNYLSVAEDDDFYYLALDLCSDRTNNKDGEWLALHLANRLPDTYGSKLAFYALEDFGYEYFYYNVSSDTVFDDVYYPGIGSRSFYDVPLIPEQDWIQTDRGDYNGDFYDLWTYYDNNNMTISTTHYEADVSWLAGNFVAIQFGVNITEKFPDVELSTIMAGLTDMDLDYRLRSNLTSNPGGHYGVANEFYCAIVEHGGMAANFSDGGIYISNANEISFPADSTYGSSVDLNHLNINATDGMFYFSLYGWNDDDLVDPTAFNIQFDRLSLRFTINDIWSIVGNSIGAGNYEIAYSYGSSENCLEDHRMFEFKIAKSEFPALEDETLYLNIAGYGTMMMVGTNYWAYPIYDFPIPPIFSSLDNKYEFLTLDMSMT